MKIFETATAPNPRRVRIFLAEKNIKDIEFIQVDIQQAENLTPDFLSKSPLGKIPVLELDNGTCISETIAICRYFEEVQPEPSLMGKSPEEKATIEMWQRLIEFYFMLPTGMCFQHTTGYFKDRMTPFPDWGKDCGEQVKRFMVKLDNHLATHTYIAGDQFSIADITALCAVDFNRVNKIRISEDQIHLKRWHDLVSSRASATA